MRVLLFLIFIFIISGKASTQNISLSGTVYDITKKTPIALVSVLTTSGNGTATDSMGRYFLNVDEQDSVYFSYLNKETPRYAVASIPNLASFNISILIKTQELPNVLVKQRNYRLDSLQNRLDYSKVFNYRKPGFRTSMNPGSGQVGVGLDLDELINMFKFKKNARMQSFQNRLLREEKEKFISHRFNKGLVRRLTGLSSPELDSFMIEYRPTLQMALQFNELEFGQFIIEAHKYFKAGIKLNKEALRREMEVD